MNEESINQIKEAIRQLGQAIVSRGQPLSDELKEGLALALDHAANRIQRLREEGQTQLPPMPEGAQLLWHLSNANPEAFVSYLRTVPDPALNNLLRNPGQLNSIIDHLSRQFPGGEPEQIDGIPKADLQSSNIYGFNYDPRSGRLLVRFQRGPTYEYEGVPPYIFKIFQQGAIPAKTEGQNEFGSWWVGKQPSLGAAFYDLIRNGPYEYQRVA